VNRRSRGEKIKQEIRRSEGLGDLQEIKRQGDQVVAKVTLDVGEPHPKPNPAYDGRIQVERWRGCGTHPRKTA